MGFYPKKSFNSLALLQFARNLASCLKGKTPNTQSLASDRSQIFDFAKIEIFSSLKNLETFFFPFIPFGKKTSSDFIFLNRSGKVIFEASNDQ